MSKDNKLGTLIDFEMYKLNNNDNVILKDLKEYSKTLQHQDVDNESAPPALAIAPKAFQASSEGEEVINSVCGLLGVNGSTSQNQQPISTVPGYVRLNPNAKYDRISIQLANNRDDGRYRRCNVYIALKESTEATYNVWLTGAATNCKTELYRGCKNSPVVKDIIDALFDKYPDIMIARLRYKSTNGFISDFHKKNTKSAIVGIYKDKNDDLVAVLVLYYEFIEIPLTNPLSMKQKKFYTAYGVYDQYEDDNEDEL